MGHPITKDHEREIFTAAVGILGMVGWLHKEVEILPTTR